jgi:hypothetical protein
MAHFNDHVVTSKFDHEISYVGGGCPIETDQGMFNYIMVSRMV